MEPTPEDLSDVYTTVGLTIISPIVSLSLNFFFYGLYIIVFGAALHSFRTRRASNAPLSKLYVWLTVSLFVLSSIYVGVFWWMYVNQAIVYFTAAKTNALDRFVQYLTDDKARTGAWTTLAVTSALVNILAEAMLIHRCFHIWNSSKVTLILLASISLVLNGIGLGGAMAMGISFPDKPENATLFAAGTSISNAYALVNAVFNSFITIITAGRIWWITRQVRAEMGNVAGQRYSTVIAIILESGILYPICQLIDIIPEYAIDPNVNGIVPVDLSSVVVQAVGIAPTLILVRAAYGKTAETPHQAVSTLSFANSHMLERNDTENVHALHEVDVDVERYQATRSGRK
ncbi:hypothetical protein V5O48_017363 [Marasmius crinis-equi]|uniref:Uncharacterized protein n=1 Tax=Marasmius crinis-equi TaxID=585013 RepID=A0ABR3EP63_9AGAR